MVVYLLNLLVHLINLVVDLISLVIHRDSKDLIVTGWSSLLFDLFARCLPGVSMIACFNVLSVAGHRSDDCVENVQITADLLLA